MVTRELVQAELEHLSADELSKVYRLGLTQDGEVDGCAKSGYCY